MKPTKNLQSILFIGAGNMSRSLIGGLINSGYPAQSIAAVDVDSNTLQTLQDDFGISVSLDPQALITCSDVVLLAVKPQIMRAVCENLALPVQALQPLIISVAAGIRCNQIAAWLGADLAIVRCMPNTPALIAQGAGGLYGNAKVNASQRQFVQDIIATISQVIWVDEESQIDAVTAVSGSGPAYFFYIIEAMQAAAQELGLSPEQAQALVLQTAYGASCMARESPHSAAKLRAKVTSKGGTTAAAIEVLDTHQVDQVLAAAMRAAAARSNELGQV